MGSRSVAGMLTLLRFIGSVLVPRFRSRAVLELENIALRHQCTFFVASGRVDPGCSRSTVCFGSGSTDCGRVVWS
jgi:hypothetical protein